MCVYSRVLLRRAHMRTRKRCVLLILNRSMCVPSCTLLNGTRAHWTLSDRSQETHAACVYTRIMDERSSRSDFVVAATCDRARALYF